jgi:hypothetical protein
MAYQKGSTDSGKSTHPNGRWKGNRVAWIAIVAVALVTLVVAMPAGATFPGSNGRISFWRFLEDKDGPGLGGVEIFSAGPTAAASKG